VEIYQWAKTYAWDDSHETFVPEYRKIWAQQIIDSEDYEEQYKNKQTSLPFQTQSFYGSV